MSPFWSFLLEASIGSALVWMVHCVFLRNLTFFGWNRVFLLAGVVLSLTFPLLDIDLSLQNTVPVQEFIISINPVESIEHVSNALPTTSLFELIGYLYLSVAVSKLLIFWVGTLLVFRKIKSATVQSFNGIKVYIRPDFKPSSIFNKILMPEFDYKSNAYLQILLHESEHVRQGHSWDLLFLHFVKSLLWINPFVYLIERALREVHEYQADNKVIQDIGVKAYCRLLVNNLATHQPNPLFHGFNQFQIKNRILMMNKCKSTNVEKWKYFIGLPLLIIMLGIISCNKAAPIEKVMAFSSDFEFKLSEGQNINDLIEGDTIRFMESKLIMNEDNTYHFIDPNGATKEEGKWNINGNKLTIISYDGNATEYDIWEGEKWSDGLPIDINDRDKKELDIKVAGKPKIDVIHRYLGVSRGKSKEGSC